MASAQAGLSDFAHFSGYAGNGSTIPWSLSALTVNSASDNPAAVFTVGADVINPITASTFINSPLYTAAYGNLFEGFVSFEERLWSQTVTTVYGFQNVLHPSDRWQMLLHNVDLGEAATIRAYDAANNLIAPSAAWAAPAFLDVQSPQDFPGAVNGSWNAATGKLTGPPASTFDSLVAFSPLADIKKIEVDYFLPGHGDPGDYQGGTVSFVAPAVIPEPGTGIFGVALFATGATLRRRRR